MLQPDQTVFKSANNLQNRALGAFHSQIGDASCTAGLIGKKMSFVETGSCTMKKTGLIPIKSSLRPTLVSTFWPLNDLLVPTATPERKSAFR